MIFFMSFVLKGGGKGCKSWLQRNEWWRGEHTVCFICEEPQGVKEGGREVDDRHS